jgi:16S rRNA (cytosine1402-N4)-methyltransferase
MDSSVHKTVLLNETIEGLNLSKGSVVLDATFGGGGHSSEICRRYEGIKIIALDQDESAFKKAEHKFKDLKCNLVLINSNFRDMDKVVDTPLDGIIFDLGLSSDQLENSGRGFSFLKDEPLLMTMKEKPEPADITAEDIVNTWGEENLANIFYGYGEERFSKKIAKAIVEKRREKEIKTTVDLVNIIKEAVPGPYRRGKIHFATRTFQALRIAVNDELQSLTAGLEKGFSMLKGKGRMAVISFHSLEDRIVKRFFKEKVLEKKALLINKKPTTASEEELKINNRARSAKLRILEKI